jgi:hypothetical protein
VQLVSMQYRQIAVVSKVSERSVSTNLINLDLVLGLIMNFQTNV